MLSKSNRKIVLVGGSTAGHILPLLEVKNELQKNRKTHFLYIGSSSQIEDRLLTDKSLKRRRIICGKFRRDHSLVSVFRNIIDVFLVGIGFFQSLFILLSYKPDLVFSKSGYISVPVGFAARFLSIPMVVHESDVVAGLATRICAGLSHKILTAFPSSVYNLNIRKRAVYCGLPIRAEFEDNKQVSDDHILITGGSQGAMELNHRVKEILPELLESHKVIHLTGPLQEKEFLIYRDGLKNKLKSNYEVKAFNSEMASLMKKSKLVISRAGATAIFEIAALGKRSLLVPITSGVASHQVANALFLKKNNMAEVLLPADGPKILLSKIDGLLENKQINRLNYIYFPSSALYIARLLGDFIDFYSLKRYRNIFMIGIGGVSMRGIAEVLKKMGLNVKGSDLKTGGHDKKNINISYDLVVYSSAANESSGAKFEHRRAHELNIPVIKRSEMVGWLMKGFRGISISGMHGKTTVSSLVASVLDFANLDPSFLIGAAKTDRSSSSKLGRGIDFVSEACEYDGSFLDFSTKIAVITNLEKEHLDYFKGGLEQIMEEFSKFIKTIQPGGAIVYCLDDDNTRTLINKNKQYIHENKITLVPYGFNKDSSFMVSDYQVKNSGSCFKISGIEIHSEKVGKFFALNCSAAFAVSSFIGIQKDDIVQAISNFKGAPRRFEYIGERNGIKIFDDYGHHPTEISNTLDALNEQFPKNRKIVIFEPHQQKRFNDFYDHFVKTFTNSSVDVIGILPVYKVPGRDEKEIKSTDDLIKQINSPKVISLQDYEVAANFLEENLTKGDILMTMGATDIFKVGRKFLERYKAK